VATESDVKQVIVMRKDLKMRRGKENSQAAHASIMWLVERVQEADGQRERAALTVEEHEWMYGSFTKVCLQVNSEEELLEIYGKAKEAGLEVHLITDAGRTEFDGPTRTCLAIGPDRAMYIDKITGGLKLY
jgi:peptidyl-tRNA hydrolase, PTH2 family